MERVAKAEETEVDGILERSLQEVRVSQEKVEQLKRKAIKASNAEFV